MVKQRWEDLIYDEASETRLIRVKFIPKSKIYKSKDWFPDVVNLVSNYHWGFWRSLIIKTRLYI
jgi:hypothetical protein